MGTILTFVAMIGGAKNAKAKEFSYYIQSDGCMASVLFTRDTHGKWFTFQ